VTNLAEMMKLWIRVEGFEQKDVAEDIGIPDYTLTRLLNGNGLEADSFLKVMQWLVKK